MICILLCKSIKHVMFKNMYQRVFLLKWYLQYYFLYDIEQIKKRKEACQKQISDVYGVLIFDIFFFQYVTKDNCTQRYIFFLNARHATLSSNIRTCASIIVVQDYMVKTRIYCRICIERTFNNNRFSLADQIVWLNVFLVIMFPS